MSALQGRARVQDERFRSDELQRPGNAADPRAGSEMKQAHSLYPEKTVEVVRNHKDGTGPPADDAGRPKVGFDRLGVDG